MNGTHQILAYVDYVKLVADYIGAINVDLLLNSYKDDGLAVKISQKINKQEPGNKKINVRKNKQILVFMKTF